MPAVAGGMIPMDDPFTNGFIKGFFLDGIGGDVQAVVDFANDPLKTARDTFNAMKYAESIAIGAVASLFTMNDSQQAAVAKAADHLAAEALIWTSLGQKLLTGQGQLNEAELNKLRIIADIANVIAGEISKAISDITPEDLGRIAGMIAYELAIETGITVAATVTAGAATTLSAARIALLTQKLKRLNRFGEKAAELLKADGKLVAKMKELFSELKANGKLDAAKHLDLLKIKCFSRDTLVHTATGPRPIGEIEPGEQIWSYHFERGVWGLCEVKERLDNTYSGPVVSISVDNTTIVATAYHPFWVIEGRDLQERSKPRELQEHEDEGHSLPGRWVNSHELRAGDCIITRSGTRALITEIRQRFDDAFPVSNLSIIGHHNYAVGDVGVLVHNTSICDDAIAVAKRDLSAGKSIDKIQDNLNQMVKNGKHTQQEVDDALAKILDPNWKPGGTVAPKGAVLNRFPDWKVGDSITKVTAEGNYPSWATIRSRYWQNRAAADGASFGPSNRAIMEKGFAPKARAIVRDRKTGEIREILVEKELHHARGNRGVPGFDEPMDLREVWPWEHENLLPPGRRLDYDFIHFK